jgi:L-amino acid N-acyltransferase YncA
MQDNAIAIRPATESDLAAINDIYNHYVLHYRAVLVQD